MSRSRGISPNETGQFECRGSAGPISEFVADPSIAGDVTARSCACADASGGISDFTVVRGDRTGTRVQSLVESSRRQTPLVGGDERVDRRWSPRPFLVRLDGRGILEHRRRDLPEPLDTVRTREE